MEKLFSVSSFLCEMGKLHVNPCMYIHWTKSTKPLCDVPYWPFRYLVTLLPMGTISRNCFHPIFPSLHSRRCQIDILPVYSFNKWSTWDIRRFQLENATFLSPPYVPSLLLIPSFPAPPIHREKKNLSLPPSPPCYRPVIFPAWLTYPPALGELYDLHL